MAKYPTYIPPPLPVREFLIAEPVFNTQPETQITTTNYYDGSGGPVHIATPAPSPPPSPKLKKSIFQTDQTVPLLLPGNGEVPKSIVEAGELYSQRMRITSATVQMWLEKDRFNGYIKGFWDYSPETEVEEDAKDTAPTILRRVEDTYVLTFYMWLILERSFAVLTRDGSYPFATIVGEFYVEFNAFFSRSG
jgi:Domain of unknown function (DUF3402)